MINKKRLLYQLFLISLLFWTGLAIIRTAHNVTKIFTEDREWIGLSDKEKKNKYFGGIYELISEIKPESGGVGFYTGGREFYYGRYELYPTKVFWYTSLDKTKEGLKNNSIKYLVVCCGEEQQLPLAEVKQLQLAEVIRNREGVVYKHE